MLVLSTTSSTGVQWFFVRLMSTQYSYWSTIWEPFRRSDVVSKSLEHWEWACITDGIKAHTGLRLVRNAKSMINEAEPVSRVQIQAPRWVFFYTTDINGIQGSLAFTANIYLELFSSNFLPILCLRNVLTKSHLWKLVLWRTLDGEQANGVRVGRLRGCLHALSMVMADRKKPGGDTLWSEDHGDDDGTNCGDFQH